MDSDRSRAPASRFWYCRNARSTPSASAPRLVARLLGQLLQLGRQVRPRRVHRQQPHPGRPGRQDLEGAVGPLPDGRRVGHTAHAVERPGRVGAEPGRRPRSGTAVGSGMPGELGATSWPSRIATTAKRRGVSSGAFTSARSIAR
ncbi:hypothetical protein GCM10020295_62460 [Streptomyces cinereospinus]